MARSVGIVCEKLEQRQLLSVTISNASFETPAETASPQYMYDPTGATWVFTGNAGIEHNGSGWNAASAPDGVQAAFLQSAVTAGQQAIGTISQTLNFSAIGTYTVSFDSAQRSGKTVLPIEFLVDGSQVGSTISPSSTTWASYTTSQFTISTTGSHTIEFTGVDTTTSDKDSFIDLVSITAVNPPTVTTPAAANPSPVTGTTTALSVLGSDVSGASNLTYTWSTTGTPPAAVSFSVNGTNAAKNTTATFSKAGTYSFLVTLTDPSGLTATSSVNVTVNQTAHSVVVTPASASIYPNSTQQFSASELDQFGNAMASQPSFTWSKTGVGSVSTSGLYTAPATTGSATVSASAGGITSSAAAVTVIASGTPTVATPAAANPSPVTGTTTSLSVLGADNTGESGLKYTWSLTGTPPAVVTYSANGTNAAKNITATFIAAGSYNFLVTIDNGGGLTATSSVTVVVNQTFSSISITPGSASIAVSATQQYTASALDQFGKALASQPSFTWNETGETGTSGSTDIGSIGSSTGLFTAGSIAGLGNVTATTGGFFDTVPVTVGGATAAANGTVTLSTFGTNGYTTVDTNSCAIAVDNLWTDPTSNFEFAAYYTTGSEIMIARRQVGSSNWQTFDSGIADTSISDDHDVISIAVDSAGYMHMSWGMHNIPLNYAISTTTVTGTFLSSIPFTIQTATNAPTLFPQSGATTNEVTYPQFYSIPNSTDLLFAYRNGGAGGGSGNGNEYVDLYNPSTQTWTNNFVIDGELTSVNAYLNRLVFDTNGNLTATWTWRATPNWQTNSNIMFAQSPDDGVTWYPQGSTTPYTLPIIQSGTPANSVAQVIETIPQGSSLINQTSMTVDQNNNPIIATYLAPNYNVSTGTGNVNRQYEVYYLFDGQWHSTQVSDRTSDTSIDSSGNDVRDLGRPIVLVDKEGRVLVVTRSEDTSMGSYASSSTPNNDIVVYYCTNLDTGNPTWNTVTLNATNMGDYEPTYDQNLWTSENELSLFFEPVGRSGLTNSVVQTLDWNEQAYFSTTITAGNTLTLPTTSSVHSVLVTNSLTIAGSTNGWTGTLDITNNEVDIANGSLATVTNQVKQGYNGGNWLGSGITSSTAASDNTHLTAVGVIQNNQSGSAIFTAANPFGNTIPGAGDILVKYTYYGDANLDGKVDGSDYSLIDNGFQQHLTGWYNGDFNYDGVVNGSDYTLIDNAFNRQGVSLAAILGDNLGDSLGSSHAANVTTAAHETHQVSNFAPNTFADGAPLTFEDETNSAAAGTNIEQSMNKADLLDDLSS